MSAYEPKVGDRVRVTEVREGIVSASGPGGWALRRDAGCSTTYPRDTTAERTVERLPDPEPEWKPGDVARDVSCGQTWFRSLYGTWIGRDGSSHDDGEFVERCEWRLLVRDGKPVTP